MAPVPAQNEAPVLSPRAGYFLLPLFQHGKIAHRHHYSCHMHRDQYHAFPYIFMVETAKQHRQIDFPGKDQGEEFQFYFRQHWIRLWRPFYKLIGWTTVLIIAAYLTGITFEGTNAAPMRHAVAVMLCVFFVFGQLAFLAAFYKYFLYVIIVTDKKVHRIKKTLLTVDDHQSIDLWTLEDITKNQHGIVQNVLGFGTLLLVMQTQDALKIHFTPFISIKHEMIMKLREQARISMSPKMAAAAATEEAKNEIQNAENE